MSNKATEPRLRPLPIALALRTLRPSQSTRDRWCPSERWKPLPDGVGQLDPDFPASGPRGHSG